MWYSHRRLAANKFSLCFQLRRLRTPTPSQYSPQAWLGSPVLLALFIQVLWRNRPDPALSTSVCRHHPVTSDMQMHRIREDLRVHPLWMNARQGYKRCCLVAEYLAFPTPSARQWDVLMDGAFGLLLLRFRMYRLGESLWTGMKRVKVGSYTLNKLLLVHVQKHDVVKRAISLYSFGFCLRGVSTDVHLCPWMKYYPGYGLSSVSVPPPPPHPLPSFLLEGAGNPSPHKLPHD